MLKNEFNFTLPTDLIAQYPADKRSSSRLLYLRRDSGEISDKRFSDVLELLDKKDVLVLNDTRVIPARVYGSKESGGSVEILVERISPENLVIAFIRASKSPKPGSKIFLKNGEAVQVVGKADGLYHLQFSPNLNILEFLEQNGEMPLPPYLQRAAGASDKSRYQTVYAAQPGAVAAPTAGLHFENELLTAIQQKGIEIVKVTLHVGAGTFQPVRADNILEHTMHSERFGISQAAAEKINQAKKQGGRVVAVGTTVVRTLESNVHQGVLQPGEGETNIFIYPGYQFQLVDALITNFHLPESTLLMLVAAFANKQQILQAYQHAIENKYRFYSYGDAMFID